MSLAIAIVAAVLVDIVLTLYVVFRQTRSGHRFNDSSEVRCRRLHKEVLRLQTERLELTGEIEAMSSKIDSLLEEHESALSESLAEVMSILDRTGHEHLPRTVAAQARVLVRPLSQEKVSELLSRDGETFAGPRPILPTASGIVALKRKP